MRKSRWLLIWSDPGSPIQVVAATETYDEARDMYEEARGSLRGLRIVPNPDVVADLLVGPLGGADAGEAVDGARMRRITALALMHLAGHLGAVFWLEGDDLRIRVPQDFPVTGAVRAAMRHYEPELLEFARQGYRDMLWREVLRRPIGGAAA